VPNKTNFVNLATYRLLAYKGKTSNQLIFRLSEQFTNIFLDRVFSYSANCPESNGYHFSVGGYILFCHVRDRKAPRATRQSSALLADGNADAVHDQPRKNMCHISIESVIPAQVLLSVANMSSVSTRSAPRFARLECRHTNLEKLGFTDALPDWADTAKQNPDQRFSRRLCLQIMTRRPFA
jgi:hypothetical protein